MSEKIVDLAVAIEYLTERLDHAVPAEDAFPFRPHVRVDAAALRLVLDAAELSRTVTA